MKDAILTDTSLCAIVRDESMNPAGGINRFLRSVLPHVEDAVVVDTGSSPREGTRDLLEEAEYKYDNLSVYDTKFEGYAQARNFALTKVKTGRVLVLDADEILEQREYDVLEDLILSEDPKAIKFYFYCVSPDRMDCEDIAHNLRFFKKDEHKFYNQFGWCVEQLVNHHQMPATTTNVMIHHFRGDFLSSAKKVRNWYGYSQHKGASLNLPTKCPSETKGFSRWKKFNPKRDEYKASELDLPEIN